MKNKNGAISIFALLACMFFLIFIMVAYRNVASKARVQVETTEVLVDIYKSDTSSSVIYNSIVTGESATGQDKTSVENNTISNTSNSGSYIAIDGKIYTID